LNQLATATLGGGCFWCLEAVFQQVRGVREVQSGYSGGHVEDPGYREVCRGTTGHAEVVQVGFDPEELDYRTLLEIFFAIHDPTTPNRQGADVGPQYRSIILYHDSQQKEAALGLMKEMEEEERWEDPLVTELVPFEAFYPAEAEHDRYWERNPQQPYCRLVIDPKVRVARERFSSLLD